jgi:hypothetical protein
MRYTCKRCGKELEVNKWFTFILGIILSLGTCFFYPYFYCDKCYGRIKGRIKV